MISSCALFLDYVESVAPKMGLESRTKMGLMLMHYITLARVGNGKVDLQQVLDHNGKPFVNKITRNEKLVRDFGFALGLEMRVPWKEEQVPAWLEQKANVCNIDIEASKARHKKIQNVCDELYVLVTFVQVARKVMQSVHKDTLCALDRGYQGHCHPAYKFKSKRWFGGKSDNQDSLRGLKASELPCARIPRACAPKSTPAPIPDGPVMMSRKTSHSSESSQSSGSSGSEFTSRKASPTSTRSKPRPNAHSGRYPAAQFPGAYTPSRSAHFVVFPTPTATPVYTMRQAQSAAFAAYHQAMWKATTGSQGSF